MLEAEENGTKINISALNRQCKVSRATIRKIRDELETFGRVLGPEDINTSKGDVLVADNATIHSGGVNSDLEQWLWDNFQVFLLWLPARTPEWNPIELVWNILVARLGTYSLEVARSIPGSHSLVVAADIILRGITHEEVQACYEKSGYMCGYV